MDAAIRFFVSSAQAMADSPVPHDLFPFLFISRAFYGHSQRLSEPFGTVTEVNGATHAQARPSISDLSQVKHLKLKPVAECPYLSRSLEVLRYFMESSEGRYHVQHMVTTGPCDTVNYALGSTLFLESLYTNPAELHQLLRMATDVIIEHIQACQRIAPGKLVSDHTPLLDGAYCICSEIRSQFSREHYEEFEMPYLKEIGKAVGPLHIHVSGPIEHSVPSTLADENIRHYKFWLRDCNLARVTEMVGDRVSVDFFRNDCMPSLGFPSVSAYFKYVFESLKPETRWTITEYCPADYNKAYGELEREGRLPRQIRTLGPLPEIA